MPVPVTPVSTAHSVFQKCTKSGDLTDSQSSVHLLRGTPASSTGPPPFDTCEQSISSLPLWDKYKTCHVWEGNFGSVPLDNQGFPKGLASAVNALAIKGAHVQTCSPPLTNLVPGCGLEMPLPPYDQSSSSEHAQDTLKELATCLSSIPPQLVGEDVLSVHTWPRAPRLSFEDGGLFAPILEDDSPDMTNGDMGSSPIEPITPFGDYVDRAVATLDAPILHNPFVPPGSQALQLPVSASCDPQFCHHLYGHIEAKDELVRVSELPLHAGLIHKQLTEPMAEWLVSYVWKVCTNVLVPPRTLSPYTLPNAPQLCLPVPLYLTARVHSLLMSTLLQPSAMLLALWYIVQLPVYFGAPGLGPERVKERRFRVELLSDACDAVDRESPEGAAAFRLIVLGCMLANKWLDDHTFSNKTWHTISNVPAQLLNKLEYFALDILSHDLSISSSAWSHWLGHLLSYHHSLTTTTHPQPIARPAPNFNGLICKTIQDIMEAPLGCSVNEPVFLGVEQRLKEKLEFSVPFEPEAFDIDLDEDGPLREEYMPKRRVSSKGSSGVHSSGLRHGARNGVSIHHRSMASFHHGLPPPAKWSPSGDEPICRPSGRTIPVYPIQPSFTSHYGGTALPAFHPWPAIGLPYAPFNCHLEGDFPATTLPIARYTYWGPIYPSAARHSQPVPTPDYYSGYNHICGYSLTGFDHRRSDIHSLSDGAGRHIQQTPSWTALHQFGYATSGQPLAPHPPMNYRSTWLQV